MSQFNDGESTKGSDGRVLQMGCVCDWDECHNVRNSLARLHDPLRRYELVNHMLSTDKETLAKIQQEHFGKVLRAKGNPLPDLTRTKIQIARYHFHPSVIELWARYPHLQTESIPLSSYNTYFPGASALHDNRIHIFTEECGGEKQEMCTLIPSYSYEDISHGIKFLEHTYYNSKPQARMPASKEKEDSVIPATPDLMSQTSSPTSEDDSKMTQRATVKSTSSNVRPQPANATPTPVIKHRLLLTQPKDDVKSDKDVERQRIQSAQKQSSQLEQFPQNYSRNSIERKQGKALDSESKPSTAAPTRRGPERTSKVAENKPLETVGRWTDEEHAAFVKGLEIHGKEWKKIAKMIPTRSVVQIRTHAQKYFQKLSAGKGKKTTVFSFGSQMFLSTKHDEEERMSTRIWKPSEHFESSSGNRVFYEGENFAPRTLHTGNPRLSSTANGAYFEGEKAAGHTQHTWDQRKFSQGLTEKRTLDTHSTVHASAAPTGNRRVAKGVVAASGGIRAQTNSLHKEHLSFIPKATNARAWTMPEDTKEKNSEVEEIPEEQSDDDCWVRTKPWTRTTLTLVHHYPEFRMLNADFDTDFDHESASKDVNTTSRVLSKRQTLERSRPAGSNDKKPKQARASARQPVASKKSDRREPTKKRSSDSNNTKSSGKKAKVSSGNPSKQTSDTTLEYDPYIAKGRKLLYLGPPQAELEGGWPKGWIERRYSRLRKQLNSYDIFYYPPGHPEYKLRSTKEALKYIKAFKKTKDPHKAFDMSSSRRKKK